MHDILKGLLNKRERDMIERDTYNRQEYATDMKDEWYYGDEKVKEIHSEWNSLSNRYIFEDYEDFE
jgi:hypothetical protein